jgi:predicted nucleic acid-binding Zn finger protein
MDKDLTEIISRLEEGKELNNELIKKLEEKYGSKYQKAKEALLSMAVKKYRFYPSGRIVWIVVGKEKEYFVIPKLYCQCDEFYINVVIRRKSDLCYHLLAQAISEKIGKYESFDVPDSDFIRLNAEWKKEIV